MHAFTNVEADNFAARRHSPAPCRVPQDVAYLPRITRSNVGQSKQMIILIAMGFVDI